MTKNKITISFVLMSFLVGCSTPPKPPECKGQFKPINNNGNVSITSKNRVVRCLDGASYG